MTVPAGNRVPEKDELLEKARRALGWPELLAALAERANSAPGRRNCLAPTLFGSAPACEQALCETAEMTELFERGTGPPGTVFEDVGPFVEMARTGGTLEPLDMVKVMDVLEHASAMQRFFENNEAGERITEWAGRLEPERYLHDRLVSSIDRDGSILDSASPELGSLRKSHAVLRDRILRRLSDMVGKDRDPALQDGFYTQRGQRYVLPVKASEQNRFEGIVHDASQSGQTVFVEPRDLVEPNNRLRLIEVEIEAEIARILHELSSLIAERADAVITDARVLGHLDFVRARTRLGIELRAARPKVNDEGGAAVKKGRHPLLSLRGVDVVPNDVELGGEFSVLVISGPNTGGKTVALTMLGLFALMTRMGMFIPAEPGAEMAVFKDVYALIGDAQDLSQDLSSFSAHMVDLIGILNSADRRSLVLLDELMSSTDPEEGSAIAAAVLSALKEEGARVTVTTHLPALKSYAHDREGFANASFAFNPETFEPTYKLVIGVPGRSLGIDIARRLGLPDRLIAAAKAEVGESARRIESLLSELAGKLDEIERERQDVEAERRRAERARREHEEARERAREHEKRMKGSVRTEVRRLVREAERELESILKAARGAGAGREEALSARESLREFRARMNEEYGREVPEGVAPLDWSKAKTGDRVIVLPLSVEATIEQIPEPPVADDDKVQVRVGKLKVTVEARNVQALPGEQTGERVVLEKPKPKSPKPRASAPFEEAGRPSVTVPPAASNTLDLRGKRAHEAESMVEDFLDEACRRSLPNVFVIHGHGTGVLKKLVREQMSSSPYVESHRPGERGEGGDGVTMATLKDLGGRD